MELNQIRYFVSVFEHQHFTLAAKHCIIAQPSLSKSIKCLEKELGGDLFIRGQSPIQPTELGRLIYPLMKQVLEGVNQINQIATHFTQLKSIPLALGVLNTIGPKYVSHLIKQLTTQHPQLEIELYMDTFDALETKCFQLELDGFIADICPTDQSLFSSIKLYTEDYHVVFNNNHEFNTFHTIRLQDLHNRHYIDRILCTMRTLVLERCQLDEIQLYPTYRSESDDWIQELIAQNLGVSILPKYSITHPNISSRPLTHPYLSRQVQFVYLTSQINTPKLAAIHALIEQIKSA